MSSFGSRGQNVELIELECSQTLTLASREAQHIARLADDSITLAVNPVEENKEINKKLLNCIESFSPHTAARLQCTETTSFI